MNPTLKGSRAPSWRSVLMLAALHGCTAAGPLPETPIEGGSAAQRELVVQELADFDRDIGAGRLTIPKIRFEPRDSLGAIRRHSGVILLHESLEMEDVRWVLRHELCHGLDFEEDLVALPSHLFERLARGLMTFESEGSADDFPADERLRRSEAMATYCSLGSLAARALESSCGEEPETVASIATWLMTHVWTGESTVDATWDPAPVATWTGSRPPDRIEAEATASPPGAVYLRLLSTEPNGAVDPFASEVLDLWSGAPIPVGFGERVPLLTARDAPAGLPEEMDTLELGWPSGPAAASGVSDLWHLGRSEPRIFIFDGESERWRVGSPTCEATIHAFFTDETSVWTAWADGASVGWAPLASSASQR